jgi:hypothetical protein
VEEERDLNIKRAWHILPGVFCGAGFAGQNLPDEDRRILLFVWFSQCHLQISRVFRFSVSEYARGAVLFLTKRQCICICVS